MISQAYQKSIKDTDSGGSGHVHRGLLVSVTACKLHVALCVTRNNNLAWTDPADSGLLVWTVSDCLFSFQGRTSLC